MESKAEKCFSLPLKYPEGEDFQETVSWSSSQTHRAEDAARSSGASLHGVFLGCACLPAGFQRTSRDGLKVRAEGIFDRDRNQAA